MIKDEVEMEKYKQILNFSKCIIILTNKVENYGIFFNQQFKNYLVLKKPDFQN